MSNMRVVVLSLMLPLFGSAGVCQVGKTCDYDLKIKPHLKAEHGDDKAYDFHSISLVKHDKKRDVYRYTRVLHNKHREFYLSAEWPKASLDFDDISPLKCYQNAFDSLRKWEEVLQTPINYGGRAMKVAKAGLLTPKAVAAARAEKEKELPPLNSSIKGHAGKGPKGREVLVAVDFRFRCTATGTMVSYEAWLQPPSKEHEKVAQTSVIFSIAGMDQDSLRSHRGTVREKWKSGKLKSKVAGYLADASKTASKLTVSYGKSAKFTDQQVRVHLFLNDGKTRLGSGLVSLYLPGKKAEQGSEKDKE